MPALRSRMFRTRYKSGSLSSAAHREIWRRDDLLNLAKFLPDITVDPLDDHRLQGLLGKENGIMQTTALCYFPQALFQFGVIEGSQGHIPPMLKSRLEPLSAYSLELFQMTCSVPSRVDGIYHCTTLRAERMSSEWKKGNDSALLNQMIAIDIGQRPSTK